MRILIPYRWRWLTGFNVLRGEKERRFDALRYCSKMLAVAMQTATKAFAELVDSIMEATKALNELGAWDE